MVSVKEQVAGSHNPVAVEVIAEVDSLHTRLEGCMTLATSVHGRSG